jgi:hypothetical protein
METLKTEVALILMVTMATIMITFNNLIAFWVLK